MRATRIIIITLLLIPGWLLYAGTTGKIAGRILDGNNNEPLIGVNVYLEGTSLGATTDLEGYYVILNIPPGKHTMVVEYLGYQTIKLTDVSVSIDLTTKQNFSLSEQTLELDEVIVVEGTRPLLQRDVTSSQALVSSDEIEVLPVTELVDVLQLQAGVTRGAGGEIHIRGGRSTEINYQVNGMSVTDVYDNSAGIEIDNSSVQELQVISGTFNAEYGNAMSGIINVVTKEGSRDFEGSILLYADDYVSNHDTIFTNITDYNPVANHNIQANLSGPVPFTDGKVTFFAMGRYHYSDGHLYGKREYNPDGSPGDNQFVAMNWNERYLGQLKLGYSILPTLKLNVEGLFSTSDFQDYDHEYKLNPDGNVKKFSRSANGIATLNHTLSSKTFYSVNVSYLFKDFNEYLYEDTQDSRYLHSDSLNRPINLAFHTRGTNLHRFYRETRTLAGRVDFNSQVSRTHLLKIGAEGKTHRLDLDDYNLQAPTDHDPTGPFYPEIPDETAPNRNLFTREPYEIAAYVQDKIELDEVIINLGLRLDYFNSNAQKIKDTTDPNIYLPLRDGMDLLSLEEREPHYYEDATPKWQISPRLGIAYPFSASGVIHFSYGHFLQVPSFQYLYNRSDYKLPETGNPGSVFGNPDLEPQKTVMYELGLKQEFTSDILIDVTGFYRDIRDWITSQNYTTLNNSVYAVYANRDYSNVQGINLTLKKRFSDHYAFDVNYTYQIAEGSNSSPEEEFNSQRGNNEPTIFLLPTEWDQRHQLNVSVFVGAESWGATVLGRYGTGLPYSPSITQYTSDRGISSAPLKNSRRKPNTFLIDLHTFYIFKVGNFELKPFLRIFNILDAKAVTDVFSDTGKPDFTTEFQNALENDRRPNTIEEYLIRPWYYVEPRKVQLGLEIYL